MVTRIKPGFKTSARYSWILPFKVKLSNSWEEEELPGFKRLCLTDHVLEFSTTSSQKELSQLRKHLNDYKRKLWDWIMLRTKRPYQERLITGGTCSRVSSQEGWRNERNWDTEPSHIPSKPLSSLCLLLIPSLSFKVWLEEAVSNHSISSILIS